MSWQDMGIYWAWRGEHEGYCKPPSERRLIYAEHPTVPRFRLCVMVVDRWPVGSETRTAVHQGEAKARGFTTSEHIR